MKITIKNKVKAEPVITSQDVKSGYVFEILDSGVFGHVKALKLVNGKSALLVFSNGADWFELKDDTSWKDSPVKILGKLTEIIVDPNV